MTLYICVKFCQNIWNGFQLTEQIWKHGRNGYVQCSKDAKNTKSRQTIATIFVFCMLSHSALHLCEVSWKYFKLYILLWSGHKWWKRWWTANTQNFGGYNIIPSPLFVAGHNVYGLGVGFWTVSETLCLIWTGGGEVYPKEMFGQCQWMQLIMWNKIIYRLGVVQI